MSSTSAQLPIMISFILAAVVFFSAQSVVQASCVGTCGGDFTDESGTFCSPDYPSKYPNRQNCKYKFDTGYPITISCSMFAVQKKNNKCKDKVRIFDDGVLSNTFCGTVGPANWNSTSSNVQVQFKSNKKKTKAGFLCTYESITTTTTSTTTTTTTTTTEVPALVETALNLYNSDTCYTTPPDACGCSGITKDDSQYYERISGSYRILISNAIPDHEYEVGASAPNRNTACPHEVYLAIPLNPMKGNTYTQHLMGPVGIARSAVFFYNHLSTPSGNVAFVEEGDSFDNCNGHSDGKCRYHYHILPNCIAPGENCSHVGYMADGFPVYTYCQDATNTGYLRSCYYLTSGDGSHRSHYTYNSTKLANGECDLDKANGYTFSNGSYGYIFTEDYPFIMAGYFGTEKATLCYLTDYS